MPQTARALEAGEVSLSAVRLLAAARQIDPETFLQAEGQLVEAARIHSVNDLKRVTAHWKNAVETERALQGDETLRERRRLHASVTFLGMVRMDGDLDPANGEVLMTGLRAYLDAEARSGGANDGRTAAQRRADALCDIVRQWLDLADRPTVGGERPHITVTVDAASLREESARPDGAAPPGQDPTSSDGPSGAGEPVAAGDPTVNVASKRSARLIPSRLPVASASSTTPVRPRRGSSGAWRATHRSCGW
jgi:Domain of unknown function (DUF222)